MPSKTYSCVYGSRISPAAGSRAAHVLPCRGIAPERQHVQARVRAAMDAQVLNEGRHQGGRAPYGYVTVNGGPHPNPRKATEGYRLRVLAIDEESAVVVRRIFA
ncbi:hypothetical protein AB0L13_34030 [Saccharopolyspora shandongensis]|uniref:hypothetical protein n=1 Tax=Saccharopolyspora shandongensis TaxID=418495 RepID=UPI003426FAE9